ncbi:hypothetical protein VI817_001215 [Penicillium citrinum]|nr:hypothetical protein VI817_001215 [Penicillium citrinum]
MAPIDSKPNEGQELFPGLAKINETLSGLGRLETTVGNKQNFAAMRDIRTKRILVLDTKKKKTMKKT